MAILNVTPDSFSDGGQLTNKANQTNSQTVLKQILTFIKQGADIIDIGAESSGPDSEEVSLKAEMARLQPVFALIKAHNLTNKVDFSIDTYKAPVAQLALEHGFKIINDVTGLRGDPELAKVAAEHNCQLVIMYSKDPSARTTKTATEYPDIIQTITQFLQTQAKWAISQGVKPENIIVDPGMGAFLSTIPDYSYEVINRLAELKSLGYPILVGASRKGFLGGKLKDRDIPTLLINTLAAYNGANILRTHNLQHHKVVQQIAKDCR